MREIQIHLEREKYSPGDRIEGNVIVVTDDSFECNAVNLRFTATERSRVVRGSGNYKRVYVEKQTHLDQFFELEGETVIQEGQTSYDFAIILPKDAPASFRGFYSFIRYELEAKVEISWAKDPRAMVEFSVEVDRAVLTPVSVSDVLLEEETRLLSVELDTDVLSPGEPFEIEVRLDSEIEFRGLRCELIHEERVSPKGRDAKRRTVLTEWYSEEFRVPRYVPVEVLMQTGDDWPRAFQSDLITCRYLLKITLDIAWRFDKVIEIPIRYGETDRETESFELVGFDF